MLELSSRWLQRSREAEFGAIGATRCMFREGRLRRGTVKIKTALVDCGRPRRCRLR